MGSPPAARPGVGGRGRGRIAPQRRCSRCYRRRFPPRDRARDLLRRAVTVTSGRNLSTTSIVHLLESSVGGRLYHTGMPAGSFGLQRPALPPRSPSRAGSTGLMSPSRRGAGGRRPDGLGPSPRSESSYSLADGRDDLRPGGDLVHQRLGTHAHLLHPGTVARERDLARQFHAPECASPAHGRHHQRRGSTRGEGTPRRATSGVPPAAAGPRPGWARDRWAGRANRARA